MTLSFALAAAAVLSTSSASAAPRPTIEQVQEEITDLRQKAEVASEQYNETREQLKSVDIRLKAAKTKLERQQSEVVEARRQVGQMAAETYRRGQLSTLDLVLGDDTDSALAQAGYLPSLAERQAGALKRLTDVEQKLKDAESEIEAQQQKALDAKKEMEKSKELVEQRIAEANDQLNTLEASQATQVRNAVSGRVPTSGDIAECNGEAVKAPTATGRAAIAFACEQLGDPYEWAASGPNTWDCSGFTLKAFAAAGISLPHSSRMQATYGTPISNSQLQPGDLVFFYSPISHVGIYMGGNKMIHAPSTGDVVKVSSLYATPTAAVRL